MTLRTGAKERPTIKILVALTLLAAAWAAAPTGTARAADPVIAAAGNIACDPASPYYNAGAGTATNCRQGETAALLSPGLAGVLALGDNQFSSGTLAAYKASYEPAWGQRRGITHPVAGNREYLTAGAAGHFDYFNGIGATGGAAGNRDQGYYSFDIGPWHLVALNSNCAQVSCAAGSAQERWLRADLAAHPAACTLGFMHAGRFGSGRPGAALSMGPLYRALYEGGVDVSLSAQSRNYERFAPQTSVGRSPAFGIRHFVVGTGGHSLGPVGPPKKNSQAIDNSTFGVLELTLQANGYAWRFVAPAGATFSDSGSGNCHGVPPPRKGKRKPKPKPPPKSGKTTCTVLGTQGNDVLRGTRGADVICGLGGNDRIEGGAGNDVLRGGDGNDRIGGGGGRDRIEGNRGRDVLSGGRGRDLIHGGGGKDVLRGQGGADRLYGEGGSNRVAGGGGNDYIDVSSNGARDVVSGGRGRDRAKVQRRDKVRGVERVTRRR
jgi:Ca2+-binding RTX toxin-like protein